MFITPISTRWVMWSIAHRPNLKTHPSHLCVPYLWCYLHINYTHIKLVRDVVNNIPSAFTSYNLNLVPHLSLVEAGALLIVQTCFDVKTSLWPPHLQPSVPATAFLLFLYFPVNILNYFYQVSSCKCAQTHNMHAVAPGIHIGSGTQ